MTVVGVVADARYREIDDPGEQSRPMMYVPHRQMPATPLALAIRSAATPEPLVGAVRDTLRAEAPSTPVTLVEPMPAILAREIGPHRFVGTLLALFASVATVLALAGLSGLIAYGVGSRTKEIGVRVALGATASDVLKLTAGRGLLLSAGGILAGAPCAWALTRLLRGVLFEIDPADPATFSVVSVLFLAVAAAAACVPARRALRIDPTVALRIE
jgi:hypothetical protein